MESYDQPRQHIKKQRHYFVNKGLPSQGYGFSSGHVWMWELDYKERWAPKNWCFWTVVLEKTLKSPLDCKEIQPVHPKGDQSWVFTGRTDVEAETPILSLPDAKSWLIWEDPDAGKDWRQDEKGMTDDEMVGWHHWLNGHGFGWTPGVGDGKGGLACCSSWGCKELDTTEQLNLTELNWGVGRIREKAITGGEAKWSQTDTKWMFGGWCWDVLVLVTLQYQSCMQVTQHQRALPMMGTVTVLPWLGFFTNHPYFHPDEIHETQSWCLVHGYCVP